MNSPVRILGLDFGDVRIGLALSDLLMVTAQPFGVLERTDTDNYLEQLAAICRDNQVGEVHSSGYPTRRQLGVDVLP